MCAAVNKCILTGTVSPRGFEMRYTASGTAVATFMLALTETWPDGTERLLFIPIEVMGRKAEAVTALAPGTAVVVDGRLMRRKVGDRWETIVGCWDLTPITVPVTPVEVT